MLSPQAVLNEGYDADDAVAGMLFSASSQFVARSIDDQIYCNDNAFVYQCP
ncbi:MAG: hypothetical protein OEW58_09485 [Gammaproteobacteria bacterium]|nr:hypothetical protein [Gammaproteobacteria bacterium]